MWDIGYQQVLNCQFSEWYPLYKDVTFKSEIITLPDHFLKWLKSDGVSLPQDTPTSLFSASNKDYDSDSDDSSNENDISSSLSTEFDFKELNLTVSKAMEKLGGTVFPKLNWSSPQDASWMNMGNLKCLHPGDVYLLLKSSDFVSHDLYYPYDSCTQNNLNSFNQTTTNGNIINDNEEKEDKELQHLNDQPIVKYTLVLRKYQNLRPERSFRCFIKNRILVGISQRDCTAYFPQLNVEKENITTTINDFLNSNGRKKMKTNICSGEGNDEKANIEQQNGSNTLLSRYPDNNFVIDVYVEQSLKVWIVDINIWAESTDSLMFAWNEPPLASHLSNEHTPPPPPLQGADSVPLNLPPSSSAPLLMRIVESESCLRPAPFSDYKAPLEMHQFSQSLQHGGGGGAGGEGSAEGLSEFIAFMAQCEKDNNNKQ
jgi:hypothetical protein